MKIKLSVYSNYPIEKVLENLAVDGFLTQERSNELLELIADSTFEPAEVNGVISKNIMFHKPTRMGWSMGILETGLEYCKKASLESLVTEEEATTINRHQRLELNSRIEGDRRKKAEVIEFKDMACDPVWDGDNYYYDLGDFEDTVSDRLPHPDDVTLKEYLAAAPSYLWTSREEPWIHQHDVGVFIPEEMPEDCDYDPHGCEELQIAIDKFQETNKEFKVCYPDYSKVVLLDEDFWRKVYNRGY
jgi:hypothetical protein